MLFRRAPVCIDVFDAPRRRVRHLLEEARSPGRAVHRPDDGGRRLDAGVYFLRLQPEGRTVARNVVLLH